MRIRICTLNAASNVFTTKFSVHFGHFYRISWLLLWSFCSFFSCLLHCSVFLTNTTISAALSFPRNADFYLCLWHSGNVMFFSFLFRCKSQNSIVKTKPTIAPPLRLLVDADIPMNKANKINIHPLHFDVMAEGELFHATDFHAAPFHSLPSLCHTSFCAVQNKTYQMNCHYFAVWFLQL